MMVPVLVTGAFRPDLLEQYGPHAALQMGDGDFQIPEEDEWNHRQPAETLNSKR